MYYNNYYILLLFFNVIIVMLVYLDKWNKSAGVSKFANSEFRARKKFTLPEEDIILFNT
jgi:uncharacterized membrane protein